MSADDLDKELWFRCFDRGARSQTRLVCLPHAGGAAPFYRPLSAALSPDIETLCVQYPGRQDRRNEPIITDLRKLARRIAREVMSLNDKPLALFGHSMGAVVAFEIASELEREGGPSPIALFASGRRSPSTVRQESVHLLDDDELIAHLRRLSGTDERVLGDEEIIRLALPAVRGDYTAIETHQHDLDQPPLNAPVTVFIGDNDPHVTEDEATAWRKHTNGAFELHVYRGGHFYLTDHWRHVADQIRFALTS